VTKVWLIESKSGLVAAKTAPSVSCAGGTGPTPKKLPTGAGVVVRPAKVPVSKSPLTIRLAEVCPVVVRNRSPIAKKQPPLAMEVFIEASSYENGKIGQAQKDDIFVNSNSYRLGPFRAVIS